MRREDKIINQKKENFKNCITVRHGVEYKKEEEIRGSLFQQKYGFCIPYKSYLYNYLTYLRVKCGNSNYKKIEKAIALIKKKYGYIVDDSQYSNVDFISYQDLVKTFPFKAEYENLLGWTEAAFDSPDLLDTVYDTVPNIVMFFHIKNSDFYNDEDIVFSRVEDWLEKEGVSGGWVIHFEKDLSWFGKDHSLLILIPELGC